MYGTASSCDIVAPFGDAMFHTASTGLSTALGRPDVLVFVPWARTQSAPSSNATDVKIASLIFYSLVQHVDPSKPIISTGPRARTCDRPGRRVNNAERRVCLTALSLPALQCHF